MVGVRVSLELEASWNSFSAKDRMAPKQIVLIHFLEYQQMQFHRENNKEIKKPRELVWKFIEKHMKIHGTKVPWPAMLDRVKDDSPYVPVKRRALDWEL